MVLPAVAPKVAERKERRAAEKCAVFGCKEKTGDEFRCPEHKADHAKSMRAWRARKAA